MIAHKFALLLGCWFTITNIKTIESAGNSQVSPIRFFGQTTDENYSRMVNTVRTFKEHPIVLDPEDQANLSSSYDSFKQYRLHLKGRDKLEKKAEEINCSFCVIAKSNISCLKNLVELYKSGERIIHNEELRCLYNYKTTENTLRHITQETELIVKLLLAENLEMGKWLWSYFLKIIAIKQCGNNPSFISENPFEDHQLETGISEFIGSCIAKNFLPPDAMESDFVSKNMSIYKNMFTELSNSQYYRTTVHNSLDRNYGIMIELLYLKPFWDDERQLLFGRIAHVDVDWNKTKQRHEVEVVVTREFVDNRTWINKPYDRIDHQQLLMKIIDARIYCYLSIILHVYEKQLFVLDELRFIKNRIYKVMKEALNLTASKDEFLIMVASELDLVQPRDVDDIKDILARVRAKADVILNDLNGANTNELDGLSFNVDESQLSSNDLIMRIITDFNNYLNELSRICLPFEYKTLLYFMDVVKLSAAQYI